MPAGLEARQKTVIQLIVHLKYIEMKVYYIPYSDESKVLWLNNFAAKLPEVKDRYTLPTRS